MPYVLTGVKLAVAYSLIGIIGSEFIMSRGGIGYEISFAYTNFDNATMYPLIVLILIVSIAINGVLGALGEALLSRRGHAMSASDGGSWPARATHSADRRAAALWQGLYDGRRVRAGLAAATLRYTAMLVTSDTFGPHLRETMLAFAVALLWPCRRTAIGFWLGFHRLSGDVIEPMVVAIYSFPKLTLYPILLLAFGLGISAKIAFGASTA